MKVSGVILAGIILGVLVCAGYHLFKTDSNASAGKPDTAGSVSQLQANANRTPKKIAEGTQPTWSPDGKKILFLSGLRNNSKAVIIDVFTGEQKVVFEGHGHYLQSVSWLDSQTVLVGDNDHLYVIDIQTGKSHVVSSSPTESYYNAQTNGTSLYWAARSEISSAGRIVFEGYRAVNRLAVYLTNNSGQEAEVAKDAYSPAWVDDENVVFIRDVAGKKANSPTQNIIAKSLKTGIEKTLATGSKPIVSRDGQKLAYQVADGRLAVLDLAASTTVFSSEKKLIDILNWSSDGKYILVLAQADSELQLQLMKTDSLEGEVLAAGKIGLADWAPDSKSIVFESDGEIMLISVK